MKLKKIIVFFLLLLISLMAKPVMASCVEECPSQRDGVLRSCTPADSDGTSQDSLCNWSGREELCGYKTYICPKAGGQWTLKSDYEYVAPTPTLIPTLVPTPVPQIDAPTYQDYRQSSDYQEFLEFRQFLKWKYGWTGVVRDEEIR